MKGQRENGTIKLGQWLFVVPHTDDYQLWRQVLTDTPYARSGLCSTLPSRDRSALSEDGKYGAFAENIPIVEIVLEDHHYAWEARVLSFIAGCCS